jgi:hypothetical protein
LVWDGSSKNALDDANPFFTTSKSTPWSTKMQNPIVRKASTRSFATTTWSRDKSMMGMEESSVLVVMVVLSYKGRLFGSTGMVVVIVSEVKRFAILLGIDALLLAFV